MTSRSTSGPSGPPAARRGDVAALGHPARSGASADEKAGDTRYLELAERVSLWMDRRYIDPILGILLPGAGDAIGAGIGLLGVYAAFRMRAHPIVIARMLINLAVDSLIGVVPLVGAIADFFYKSHTRNLILLRAREARTARASDWLIVVGSALLFMAALVLPIVVVAALVSWLR